MNHIAYLIALLGLTACLANENGRTVVHAGISGPGWTFDGSEIEELSVMEGVISFDDRIHGNAFHIRFKPDETGKNARTIESFATRVCTRAPYAGLAKVSFEPVPRKSDEQRFIGNCRRFNHARTDFIVNLRHELSDIPGIKHIRPAVWAPVIPGHARIVFYPSDFAPDASTPTFVPFSGDPEKAPSFLAIKSRVATYCTGPIYTDLQSEILEKGCAPEGWGGRSKQGVKCQTYKIQCRHDQAALVASYQSP